MKTWTPEEVELLKENYNKASNEELSRLIPQKTRLGIYKKAYKLGLRKSPEIEWLNRSCVRRGEKGANWKGGVSTSTKGYRMIHCHEHERADARGYVMEHIVIFERETGIKIPTNCCVHHINGNKQDNRIENLCMMTHSAHTAYHNRERGKHE